MALLDDLAGNVKSLLALHQRQQEYMLDMLECCLWEIRSARPLNPTDYERDKFEQRLAKRKALIKSIEALLASAGRDVSGVRSARAPATDTGD